MPQDSRFSETDSDNDEISLAEAAAELGLRQVTLRAWANAGDLPARKRGRAYVVSRAAIARFLEENPTLGLPRNRREDTRPPATPAGEAAPLTIGEPTSATSGSAPLVSRQSLRDHVRQAEALWENGIRAFDPLPDRLRSLANGAYAQARVINLAELAEVPWKGRDDGVVLPESLRPGADREGPQRLWAQFDASVAALGDEMRTPGNNRGVQLAFEGLRDAAAAIANALDPPQQRPTEADGDLRQTG